MAYTPQYIAHHASAMDSLGGLLPGVYAAPVKNNNGQVSGGGLRFDPKAALLNGLAGGLPQAAKTVTSGVNIFKTSIPDIQTRLRNIF